MASPGSVTRSRSVVRTVLKLLAVALLAFIVYWGISNAFVHSEPVAGTKLTIKTQLGDDGRSLPAARRAARQADRWLGEAFGRPISEATSIRLARSGNCQWIDSLLGEQSTAWNGSGGICVYTGRGIWKAQLAGDGGRDAEELVIHELVHSAQRELGCVDEPDEHRFRWLMEGTAVYGAREALILSGRRRAQETDAYIRSEGGYRPDLVALQLFEKRSGDGAAYQLWHRAVRRLADEHGSVGALREFCAAVGEGRGWRAAFADAFGLSPAAFYAEFERARR